MDGSLTVRHAAERFVTRSPGVLSRHAFSFGVHYDPANTSHGVLVACNDDVVQPGAGYPTHPHREVELVTWVVEGTLRHTDATGRSHALSAGTVQHLSAGSGLTHSEVCGGVDPVRFVQMWVVPDSAGLPPAYALHRPVEGPLVAVASGRDPRAPLLLRSRSATLHVGRLTPGQRVTLPEATYVHVFVVRGTVGLGGRPLTEGDEARLTRAGVQDLTAEHDAEVLVWEMHAGIG